MLEADIQVTLKLGTSLHCRMTAKSPMYVPAAVRKCSIARLLEVADMYPAFGSACCLPWPCWEYARAAVSLVT